MSATLYVFNEPKWPEAAEKADWCASRTKRFWVCNIFVLWRFFFFFLSLMNRTPDRRSVSLRLLCSQTASPAAQTPCFLPQKFFDKVTVQMWMRACLSVSVSRHAFTIVCVCLQNCTLYKMSRWISILLLLLLLLLSFGKKSFLIQKCRNLKRRSGGGGDCMDICTWLQSFSSFFFFFYFHDTLNWNIERSCIKGEKKKERLTKRKRKEG